MTEQPVAPLARRQRRARRDGQRRPRHRATFVSVLGELLVTAGMLVLLFVAWQLWIGDWIGAAQKNAAGAALSQQWAQEFAQASPAPSSSPDSSAQVPVAPEPKDAEVFGIMSVPRFGADYRVEMAGGVSRARTLDPIGIGHYPGQPMPGAVGNASFAAHRTTFGKPFNKIAELRLNDPIVIETKAGWYTYRFRTLEYVKPDAVDVLLPVPQQPDAHADERYLTMTSCSPMYSRSERIVAYSVFDTFTPRADGEPAVLRAGGASGGPGVPGASADASAAGIGGGRG